MLVTKTKISKYMDHRETEIKILYKAGCQLDHNVCSTCLYHLHVSISTRCL